MGREPTKLAEQGSSPWPGTTSRRAWWKAAALLTRPTRVRLLPAVLRPPQEGRTVS